MKIMVDAARSVAANTTTANILDGKPEVYLSAASALRVLASAAAVGILATVLVGDTVVVQDQEISNTNRYPFLPDDFLAEMGGAPGDLVFISLRNRTAGAIIVNTVVQVERVG